ncbi:MAG: hypothetical protein K0R63_975 [Rickettsiales bacterium]|jgi:hypothetical protein|nr:hypothetical protein [Rickettsiales bacterium]
MKDLYHNLKITQLSKPAVATGNVTSDSIDMQGYQSLSVLFDVGQSGDTLSGSLKWTLTAEESDNDSDFTAVGASDLHNGVASVVIDEAAEDETVVTFGYKGAKRYIRAVATKTGTHTNGTPIGIVAVQGHAGLAPVA